MIPALIIVAAFSAVVIGTLAFAHELELSRRDEQAQVAAERDEERHRSELERVESIHSEWFAMLSAEREQWARIAMARNAGEHGALLRVDRTPPDAMAESEIRRAEAIAGRTRGPEPYQAPDGSVIAPVGME